MKFKLLKSLTLAAGAMLSSMSFAGIITDVVSINSKLNSGQSKSWTHDVNDNGFVLGSAYGGFIEIDLQDDGGWFDGFEKASIKVEFSDLIFGDDSSWHVASQDYLSNLSVSSLISLNADGLLDVMVKSVLGDFYVVSSTLSVFAYDAPVVSVPVPEPATLALFGLGLMGLGIARHKAKK